MMGRMIIVKLQPNQDVTEALERAIYDAGMTAATVCGAVGSLVEAIIERDGVLAKISGPGLEVAGLAGRIEADGNSLLSGFVCRPDTGLEFGVLVRGMNAVGVTFELALEEIG